MKYFLIIISAFLFFWKCVKPASKDPIPSLDYKSVNNLGKVPGSVPPRDTAVLVLGYEDGDGDLFRNSSADGPNLIYTTYYYDADQDKFLIDGSPNSATVRQPDNGYYKGKSIQGEIYIPLSQFRSGDDKKILKFEAFMIDMKDNKTNVVTSPVFTLNF
jgi:hypothetical protein